MIFISWTSIMCSTVVLFFVPFPLVLSYHGVTLELWQLLYENGDPHIIFNNYSKSAKILASRKIEFQMKKNLNVEDNIGVPFGNRLKIRLWQKWKGLEMFKFKILNKNIICHKGLYQQLTHIPRISWFNCNDTLRTFSRQLFFCLVRLKCHTLIISQFLIKVIETLVLSWLFAQIHVYQNVIQC